MRSKRLLLVALAAPAFPILIVGLLYVWSTTPTRVLSTRYGSGGSLRVYYVPGSDFLQAMGGQGGLSYDIRTKDGHHRGRLTAALEYDGIENVQISAEHLDATTVRVKFCDREESSPRWTIWEIGRDGTATRLSDQDKATHP